MVDRMGIPRDWDLAGRAHREDRGPESQLEPEEREWRLEEAKEEGFAECPRRLSWVKDRVACGDGSDSRLPNRRHQWDEILLVLARRYPRLGRVTTDLDR